VLLLAAFSSIAACSDDLGADSLDFVDSVFKKKKCSIASSTSACARPEFNFLHRLALLRPSHEGAQPHGARRRAPARCLPRSAHARPHEGDRPRELFSLITSSRESASCPSCASRHYHLYAEDRGYGLVAMPASERASSDDALR